MDRYISKIFLHACQKCWQRATACRARAHHAGAHSKHSTGTSAWARVDLRMLCTAACAGQKRSLQVWQACSAACASKQSSQVGAGAGGAGPGSAGGPAGACVGMCVGGRWRVRRAKSLNARSQRWSSTQAFARKKRVFSSASAIFSPPPPPPCQRAPPRGQNAYFSI